MSLKVDKFVYGSRKALNKIVENADGGSIVSRELQMVPKYLECAKLSGKEGYRFNDAEVKELTSAFAKYETKLSLTDVLKELLTIGSEGNVKPLGIDEIKAFLKATSGMKNQEQKNVLNFLKVSRQDMPVKLTLEQLEAEYPYEKFKSGRIALDEQYGCSTAHYTDEYFKKVYSGFINNEFRIRSNPYYAAQLKSNQFIFSDHLLRNDSKLIKAVSEVIDSQSLYEVFKIAGTGDNAIAASKDLVSLYKMSNGNKTLIKDLATMFYPSEVKHIREAVEAEVEMEAHHAVIKQYNSPNEERKSSLRTTRSKILSLLRMSDEVRLLPIRTAKNEDIYPSKQYGNVRGRRIAGGNYEHGKKK